MKEEILSRVYSYKYEGEQLSKFRDLISIIKDVTQNIEKTDMIDIGIHLVLESRNHRWVMSYSKAYEMATDIFDEIKIETQNLINVLPKNIIEPLTFMNEKLTMWKSQLENNNFNSWILIAEPWKFYILETSQSAKLFINDFENDLQKEIPTDDMFNWKIKNDEKAPYEMIYSKINEWKNKKWMKKASLQHGV